MERNTVLQTQHPTTRSPWPSAVAELPLALKDKDLQRLFGVKLRTIQRWREQGKLPPKQLGLTPRDEILARLRVIREAA
jgi:hypothetical protein